MKNEAHVIGDRVPNERDLIFELKLAPQNAGSMEFADEGSPAFAARLSFARRIFGFVVRKFRERRNRLALLELNDDQLKDIGLSRCQAYGGHSRYRRNEPAVPCESAGEGQGVQP